MTAREIMKIPAAVAAYLALGGVVLGTMLAFGLISPVFDGFAHEAQFQQSSTRITHTLLEMRIDNTSAALLRMDLAHCGLKPGPFRDMYDQNIMRREQEYYRLTGQQYSLPSCGSL